MNRPASSKFVPGLPADDDIDTQTNSQGDNSIKIYDGVAECTMNDADTLKSVKIRAKDLAIQKVQLKIADYVYGFWKDRYLTLPDDEVLSIANEICTITDVKYNMQDSDGDKMIVRSTVLAQVDDKDVMNYIIQFFKERNELKIQNETLRKENSNLKLQIAKLKSQHTNNQQNTSQVVSKDKIALAKNKFDNAYGFYYKKDYESAIKLFNEVIELNPNFEAAYYYLGDIYFSLERYSRAIQDYSKAIELNPKYAAAYFSRRLAYQRLGNNEKAQADFKKYEELSKIS